MNNISCRRIPICIIIISLILGSICGYSQTITVNRKNATLEDILLEIHRQVGYSYSASDKTLNLVRSINIDVKGELLNKVLDLCLKGQPLSYTVQNKVIIIKQNGFPLDSPFENNSFELIDLKGQIVNEFGIPTIATVTVKGTNKATTTDAEGYFVLKNINGKSVIIISGVNIIAAEIDVNGRKDLATIKVGTKITTGEDVVVEVANTGYQTLKPNETNGSLVVISNKILNEQSGTNILQRLNGVTSSLLFNIGKSDSKGLSNPLSIRGLSTINGSTAPLIVLDNVVYDGNIENINPNDIESITVLKDAAATSIYGVGGGNGVIVITSKKGQFNQRIKIDFNSNLIVTGKPDLFYLPRISSSDYIDLEKSLFKKGYFDNVISLGYPVLTPVVELLKKNRDGLLSDGETNDRIDNLRRIDSRKEYNKYFSSNASTQQHSMIISGGSKNLGWLFSTLYEKNLGSSGGLNQKINIRSSNTYKPTNNLNFTQDIYFTNGNSESGRPGLSSISFRNVPYLAFADENGSPLSVPRSYNSTYSDTVGGGKLLSWKYFPLEDYKHDIKRSNLRQLIFSFGVNYKIIPTILFNLSYQYQRQWLGSKNLSDVESFYTRDLINQFTNLQSTVPEIRNPVPIGGILSKINSATHSQNLRIQANIAKKWGRHNLSIISGSELRETVDEGSDINTSYGYRDIPTTSIPVDFRTPYVKYVTGVSSTIPNIPSQGPSGLNRFISIYGNAAYTFKKTYSINGSFRRDASNIFGLATNDKWNPLWSSGLGWEISEEKFYGIRNILPSLKLKITWGYSGNLDKSKTALPIINYGINPDLGVLSATVTSPNNPELRWEKSRQMNLGLTFSSIKQIVSGTIEYYTKKGTDLYGETMYDYTAFGGTPFVTRNIANMKGTGVDVNLQIKVFNSYSFRWNTTILYNYNVSKTTKYSAPLAQDGRDFLANFGNKITPAVGKPMYSIAAYKWGGLDNSGNPQGILNGKPTNNYGLLFSTSSIYSEQIKFIGVATPSSFGAIANRFIWKNISVSINILYKLGYYFVKPSFSEVQFLNSGIGHKDFEKRWRNPGDELYTNIPSFLYPAPLGIDLSSRDWFFAHSEVNVLKADNIRLQFISFEYNFPFSNKKTLNMSIYGNASNLAILWRANKEDIDPDYPNSAPPPKSYTIGMRINL